MELEATAIPGCYILLARPSRDTRGTFVKTFHYERFGELGLRTDWKEEYYSVSARGVIRGMHFQLPPAEHAKLVFCLAGEVLDVVVDLRRGSPAFGHVLSCHLSAENGRGLYLPTGCAHGFLSLTDGSGMYYKVTSVHAPAQDAGVAWDSIGFDWPVDVAVLSQRDRLHPSIDEFDSPFVFDQSDDGR